MRAPHLIDRIFAHECAGDGDIDLIISHANQVCHLLLNDGSGGFTLDDEMFLDGAGKNTNNVALGDLDGDGDLDVIFTNGGAANELWRNDGTGRFKLDEGAFFSGGQLVSAAIALADFNRDGVREWVSKLRSGSHTPSTPPHTCVPVLMRPVLGGRFLTC